MLMTQVCPQKIEDFGVSDQITGNIIYSNFSSMQKFVTNNVVDDDRGDLSIWRLCK